MQPTGVHLVLQDRCLTAYSALETFDDVELLRSEPRLFNAVVS
jgi:hypothetical protein